MAATAFQVQYRQEYIAGFEQSQSLLRASATTEAVIKGNTATFLVADSGNATAVTRGVNGLIPGRADNLNQYSATLVEWHDKPRRTEFNIFASQGDGRRIMQETTQKVMNRKIDQDILGELANASNTTGAAATASLAMVMKAQAILGKNEVPVDEVDNLFFVASPAFRAYLMQTKEFGSRDWVDMNLPFLAGGPSTGVGPTKKVERWAGFNWIWHPRLSGAGTASETCFAFHKSAIGHAVNTGEMDIRAGYNEEEAYYYARSSIFMGSKLLQNSGVVKVYHDGSAF